MNYTDEQIEAMWLLFLCAPQKREPEDDGSFSLGEIGPAAPMLFERVTPYSIAEPNHETKEAYQITIRPQDASVS